jgi:EmrB/QacA subfamily drug resistance transporter
VDTVCPRDQPDVGLSEDQVDPRRWRALSVTLAAGFMGLLDVSIVAVALPSIEKSLGVSASGVQWVVSGYALAFGLALVPAGRLGDAVGRRRMFVISLAGFVLTSVLCGAAPSLLLLIIARLLQGFTAGMLDPQNAGVIQDLFRGAERGRAFGLYAATVGLSMAVGPIVGGMILAVFGDPDGWRWIFYVNVPIGLVALALAPRLLPGRSEEQAADRTPVRRRLDLVGTVLLGAGVLAMMMPLLEYDHFRNLWWLIVLGTALLVGFGKWESRVARIGDRPPLLDPRLLTSTPGYASGSALGLAYFVGFSGIFVVLALFFQFGLGYSPLQSGLAVTPFAVGAAVSAHVAGAAVVRWGRWLTVCGLCVVVAGFGGRGVRLARPDRVVRRPTGGRAAAGSRRRQRHGDLAEHHADPRRGAGADGRRGWRRAADRPAARFVDRHRAAGRGVLHGTGWRGATTRPSDLHRVVVRRGLCPGRVGARGARPGPCRWPAGVGSPGPRGIR